MLSYVIASDHCTCFRSRSVLCTSVVTLKAVDFEHGNSTVSFRLHHNVFLFLLITILSFVQPSATQPQLFSFRQNVLSRQVGSKTAVMLWWKQILPLFVLLSKPQLFFRKKQTWRHFSASKISFKWVFVVWVSIFCSLGVANTVHEGLFPGRYYGFTWYCFSSCFQTR